MAMTMAAVAAIAVDDGNGMADTPGIPLLALAAYKTHTSIRLLSKVFLLRR